MAKPIKQQVWMRESDWGVVIDLLDHAGAVVPTGILAAMGRKQVLRIRAELRRQLKLLEPK